MLPFYEEARHPRDYRRDGKMPAYINTLPLHLEAFHLAPPPSERSQSRLSTSSQVTLPPDWVTHIHPGGWKYYHNPVIKLVTDFSIDICLGQDELIRAQESDGDNSAALPIGWEKWIDTGIKGSEHLYINHSERRAMEKSPLTPGFVSLSADIRNRTDEEWDTTLQEEAGYWGYMTQHPCHAPLPQGAEQNALAQLTYFAADRMLNGEDSVVPFSKEASQEMLGLLNSMIATSDVFSSRENACTKTLFVSRLMERIMDERVRQKYGHYQAREHLKRGRHPRKYEEVKLLWPFELALSFCMTFLCFGSPYSYLRRIDDFFINPLGRTDTITEKWRRFVDENVDDWTNTNLVATVLVSGAVALIAIPGIDPITRVMGFLSVLSALASLICGLLNSWQYQHESHSSIELTIILDFFAQAQKPIRTFKILALILALPMSLLAWAAITFAVAIVILAWKGIDPNFVPNVPEIVDFAEAGRFKFGHATAWVTTGTLVALTAGIAVSFFFFLRVWTPPHNSERRHG